jgi:hypothetical protein
MSGPPFIRSSYPGAAGYRLRTGRCDPGRRQWVGAEGKVPSPTKAGLGHRRSYRRLSCASPRLEGGEHCRSAQSSGGNGFVRRSTATSCRNTGDSSSSDDAVRPTRKIRPSARTKIRYSGRSDTAAIVRDHPRSLITAGQQSGHSSGTPQGSGTPHATSTSFCASTSSISTPTARTDHSISGRPQAARRHVPGAAVRVLRRDRLCGLVHEYVQVA